MDAMELIQNLAEILPSVDDSKVLGELADYSPNEKKNLQKLCVEIDNPDSTNKLVELYLYLNRTLESGFSWNYPLYKCCCRHVWVHSAKRNRLTTERAGKLVSISHNLTLSEQKTEEVPKQTATALGEAGASFDQQASREGRLRRLRGRIVWFILRFIHERESHCYVWDGLGFLNNLMLNRILNIVQE